jgi:hypothetical protein
LGLRHEPNLALQHTLEAEVLDIGEMQIAELQTLLEESREAEF